MIASSPCRFLKMSRNLNRMSTLVRNRGGVAKVSRLVLKRIKEDHTHVRNPNTAGTIRSGSFSRPHYQVDQRADVRTMIINSVIHTGGGLVCPMRRIHMSRGLYTDQGHTESSDRSANTRRLLRTVILPQQACDLQFHLWSFPGSAFRSRRFLCEKARQSLLVRLPSFCRSGQRA